MEIHDFRKNKSWIIIEKDFEDLLVSIKMIHPPQTILLFGSRARGNPREDSDIDLCILYDQLPKRNLEVLQDLYKEIFQLPGPGVDLVVYQVDDFNQKAQRLGSLENVIQREGKIVYPLPQRSPDIDRKLIKGLQTAKQAFPEASFIVFGSHARGTATPDSDLDVFVVFPTIQGDSFDLAYQVRVEIHKHLDVALDVVICDQSNFLTRSKIAGTIEYAVAQEGFPI